MIVISIIIPFHNSLDKLIDACKSVKNQSIGEKYFKDIIIGNDSERSDIQMMNSLKSLNDKRCKIRVIKNLSEKGPGNTRNAALSLANGDLIAFLDSDDMWDKNKLAEQLKVLKEGYDFITCAIRLKGTSLVSSPPIKISNINDLFLSYNAISTSTVILKKDLIANIRFNNLKFCQDLNFWADIFNKNKVKYKSIQKALVTYSMDGRTSRTNYVTRAYYYIKSINLTKLRFSIKIISFLIYALRNLIKKSISLIFLSFLDITRKLF